MIAAGDLRWKITLMKPVKTVSASGAESTTYQEVAQVWAAKKYGPGSETYPGEQKVAQQRIDYSIRYRTDIDETWRITEDNKIYEVISIAEIGYKQGLQVVTERTDNK